MKSKFLPITFFALGLLTVANSFSQSKKFFAVTGEKYGSVNWIAFRQVDLNDNNSVRTLFLPAEGNDAVYDAATGRQIVSDNSAAVAASSNPQTCGCLNSKMVAAIAYDVKNNRLYYTQMLGNQLRYLDLNSTQIKSYAVTAQLLKNFPNQPGEASVITRMVIASDGFGYALTNDNEHLIRFSTGKQTAITDLGSLVDAKLNGENTIKTAYKSWGGDLIADANGALYLFAMQRSVYKINPNTRLATFLGTIKNIPEDYTINAAMVEQGGNVIVGSSTKTTNYYRVNLTTLEASVVAKNTEQVYNVSDFANGNLAFSKATNTNAVAKTLNKNGVSIFPNPVVDKSFSVQFRNIAAGKYSVQVSEQEGKTLLTKEITIAGNQTEKVFVPSTITSGVYMLKVTNQKGELVYTNEIVVN